MLVIIKRMSHMKGTPGTRKTIIFMIIRLIVAAVLLVIIFRTGETNAGK